MWISGWARFLNLSRSKPWLRALDEDFVDRAVKELLARGAHRWPLVNPGRLAIALWLR